MLACCCCLLGSNEGLGFDLGDHCAEVGGTMSSLNPHPHHHHQSQTIIGPSIGIGTSITTEGDGKSETLKRHEARGSLAPHRTARHGANLRYIFRYDRAQKQINGGWFKQIILWFRGADFISSIKYTPTPYECVILIESLVSC